MLWEVIKNIVILKINYNKCAHWEVEFYHTNTILWKRNIKSVSCLETRECFFSFDDMGVVCTHIQISQADL